MKSRIEPEVKCNRAELLQKVQEIVRANTHDPANELITIGKALADIGQALKDVSPQGARAVLMAVLALN